MAEACSIARGADFPALARHLFGHVRLHFGDGPEQSRRLASASLGAVRVSDLEAGVHTVCGDHVVQATHDPDSLKLLFQTEGASRIEQGGRMVEFGSRIPVLYDPTRPYTLVNRTRVRLLMIQVPREAFSQAAVQALAAPMLISATFAGLCRVVRSTMETSLAEAGRLDDSSRAGLGEGLVSLVRPVIEASIAAAGGQGARSLDLLLLRAKAYIEANLDRADLTVERIAARMGCSRSYLFRAFESEGMAPVHYIWDQRLERARAELTAAPAHHRSIADIAFSAGFTSSAHFSRAFRNRFAISPRDCRHAARG